MTKVSDFSSDTSSLIQNLFCFQFVESEDAKKALEQMNGFELAGRPMKVGQVTERADAQAMGAANAQGHNQVGSSSTYSVFHPLGRKALLMVGAQIAWAC